MKNVLWEQEAVPSYFHGSEKPTTAIVCLHGFGDRPKNFLSISKLIPVPNSLWLALKAPFPDPIASGRQWFELYGDPRAQIDHSFQALETFFRDLPEKIEIPFERIFILGFSQGAVMALRSGLTLPFPFAGIIALNGFLIHDIHLVYPQRKDIPIFLGHGTADGVVYPFWQFLIATFLKDMGFHHYQTHMYSAGHHIIPQNCKDVLHFIKEHS